MTYKIPEDIRNVDAVSFSILKKTVGDVRMHQDSYILAFTAMIHLEEASESKCISKFDIEDIRLYLNSSTDQSFKVGYNVSKM